MLLKNDQVTRGCVVPGCEKKHKARGYCEMHALRIKRWGTPDGDPAKKDPSRRGRPTQTMGPKVCPSCRVEKPQGEYWRRTTKQGERGYLSSCKDCSKAKGREYSDRYKKRSNHAIPESATCSRCSRTLPGTDFVSCKSTARGIKSECKECFRAKYRGLALNDLERLRNEQGELCAICGQPCSHRGLLSIDHDHETGAIRGLLCTNCNLGLGQFGDDADRLIAAAAYLLQRTNVLGVI